MSPGRFLRTDSGAYVDLAAVECIEPVEETDRIVVWLITRGEHKFVISVDDTSPAEVRLEMARRLFDALVQNWRSVREAMRHA